VLANCVLIEGCKKDIVPAFRAWVNLNLDPTKYSVGADPNWKAALCDARPTVAADAQTAARR
jgi:hypothetical protein